MDPGQASRQLDRKLMRHNTVFHRQPICAAKDKVTTAYALIAVYKVGAAAPEFQTTN